MNRIEQVLLEASAALGLEELGLTSDLQTTLLTPRFPTSRHVVALVHAPGDRLPRAVAKVPRRPGDDAGVRTEVAALDALASLAGGQAPGVPRVLGTLHVDGRTMLVQTAVTGVPLEPARVAADVDGAVSAGVRFLSGLPVVRSAEENRDWYERLITVPLDDLLRLAPLDGETARLCELTHALLAPLRDTPLPGVFEHGDLSHPNLFLSADGTSLEVIDWERAVENGLPGHDLVFFAQYVSQCRGGAATRADQLAAFDEAFCGPEAWAGPVLERHLSDRGVPSVDAALLVLAGWARTAATLTSRLAADRPGQGSAVAVAELVRADRDVALWRHALRRAEQGELLRSAV